MLRENAGLTQKQLAEEFNIYYNPVISMYESEKRALPIDVLVKYSEKFNVSTDWILKGDISKEYEDEFDLIMKKIRHSKYKEIAMIQLTALLSIL
ncbi:Helix-turn-helix [Butyrivibrio sp. ob235]|nr:Helix-turn-helix [Butyrivibrio sp. ob235]